MTFCKVNDCSRQVTFPAEVDSGFCVEHLDISKMHPPFRWKELHDEQHGHRIKLLDRLSALAREAFGYDGDDPIKALELGVVRLQAEVARLRPVYESAVSWAAGGDGADNEVPLLNALYEAVEASKP